jgi:Gpi18-like mannosyltransferase
MCIPALSSSTINCKVDVSTIVESVCEGEALVSLFVSQLSNAQNNIGHQALPYKHVTQEYSNGSNNSMNKYLHAPEELYKSWRRSKLVV